MQKAASPYEWNSTALIHSRAGSALAGSEIHSETELNFPVHPVLGWSSRAEHPSQILHSNIIWTCPPAQHETLTSSQCPWAGFAAQPKGTCPAASHASCAYSGSGYLQCPHLIKPTGGPKLHNLVLDQDSYFRARLSPGFLLFGIPQAWSRCRNVHLENRQFPVIQERFGIQGYIYFCI